MIWQWRVLFSPMPARKIFPSQSIFLSAGAATAAKKKYLDRLTQKKAAKCERSVL